MSLYNNATKLQNSITNQPKSAKSAGTGRIGARLSASIAKDLGGGKYILNLGGSETLVVESESKLQENQQVNLELRSTSEGRVEFKIVSSQTSENQSVNITLDNDTAIVTRDIQISINTSELSAITADTTRANSSPDTIKLQGNGQTSQTSQTSQNAQTSQTGQDSPATATAAQTESLPQNKSGQMNSVNTSVTSASGNDIRLILNENTDPSQPQTVKVLLPDGRVIDAELISEDTPGTAEIKDSKTETSLKDIIFNNSSAPEISEGRGSEATNSNNPAAAGGIKDMLTAIAGRLFSRDSAQALASEDKTIIARMLINELTLPLTLLDASSAGSATAAQINTPQLSITLPYQDNIQIISDILNTQSGLSITTAPEGNYTLGYTDTNGNSKSFPLPEIANQNISNVLSETSAKNIPVEIGVKSLLQGVIHQSIKNTPVAQTAAEPSDLPRTPNDTSRLDSLLKRCGMTPSTATREAAAALLNNSQTVTRDNISSLLALSAGKTGNERAAFLNAGAKLISLDAPLSPALASGMSLLDTTDSFLLKSIENIDSQIKQASANIMKSTQTEPAPEPDGSASAPAGIQTTLNKAAQTLKGIPILIETLKENNINSPENTQVQPENSQLAKELEEFVSTSARERLSNVEDLIQKSAQEILQSDPVLSRLSKALDAVLSKLGNLPEELPPEETDKTQTPKTEPETPENQNLRKITEKFNTDLDKINPKDFKQNISEMLKDLPIMKERFAHPGINRIPEIWQKVEIDTATLQNSDLPRIREAIQNILSSANPDKAHETTRELLRSIDRDTLRTLASTLQEIEKEEIQKHPGLQNLRQASNELRELGRALIAQKTENIANSRNDPASFNTSIPFNFNNEAGGEEEGQLSMFYNKSKGRKGRWQQRVILDLNMSALGNIIGDIQFFEGMINVNLVTSAKDTVHILEADKISLLSGLEDLGFTASIGIRLLETPAAASSSGTDNSAASDRLLDIKA